MIADNVIPLHRTSETPHDAQTSHGPKDHLSPGGGSGEPGTFFTHDAIVAELTRQRDDALRVALSRGETITRLVGVVADQVVRIAVLEAGRDLSTRALERARAALHGARVTT